MANSALPMARLLTPTVPLWRYTLEAWPCALVPSVMLALLAAAVVSLMDIPLDAVSPENIEKSLPSVISAVVLGPIVETGILALVLMLLGRYLKRPVVVAATSAVLWGALHGFLAPLWFFGTVWAFFVFSCAFLAWRGRSFGAAFVAAAVPHGLVNLSAILLGVLLDA